MTFGRLLMTVLLCGSFLLPARTMAGLSSGEAALAMLDTLHLPDSSRFWPNITAHRFVENLRVNITHPLAIYQGSNTNFCGYAALAYIPLHDDPVAYVSFLSMLYREGKATWNDILFKPSKAVRQAAGTLRFKGVLDIRPADQMWFLVLADHFKSYVNFFFPHYHTGSEDTFWAAVSYGKFNRIIRRMFHYDVEAVGSDLLRPGIGDMYKYLSQRMREGITYLYVNNTYLYQHNHGFKFGFPTHYIILQEIRQDEDGMLTLVYWDYGIRTLQQLTPRFLDKITFGISHCVPSR